MTVGTLARVFPAPVSLIRSIRTPARIAFGASISLQDAAETLQPAWLWRKQYRPAAKLGSRTVTASIGFSSLYPGEAEVLP